jgi:hypothetical protein
MAQHVAQYKGFTLIAQALKMAQGYAPRVTLKKRNGANWSEHFFDVPTTGQGIPDEAEAVTVAFDYGKGAIDGRIPGIDRSKLR